MERPKGSKLPPLTPAQIRNREAERRERARLAKQDPKAAMAAFRAAKGLRGVHFIGW